MDITKHEDFFNPTTIDEPIHIIGCGAIGSTVAETLTRLGFTNLHLYDFDVVTPHNIANQIFRDEDIDKPKTEALKNILYSINQNVTITTYSKGYIAQSLSGYVILAVDNIELRNKIATNQRFNTDISAILDFRMGLSTAQHYLINWSNQKDIDWYIKSTEFTSKEAEANAPKNACGLKLNLIMTVRTIVSLGITNFIKLLKKDKTQKLIQVDVLSNLITTI